MVVDHRFGFLANVDASLGHGAVIPHIPLTAVRNGASAALAAAIATLVNGMTGAVHRIARHQYLTVAIPYRYRARALPTLGGAFRVEWLPGMMAGS